MPEEYLPILILIALAVAFAIMNLGMTFLLGRRKSTVEKDSAYECGIVPQTNARGRFSVKFFLVAILFIVFDVETIFLYPWAVNLRSLGVYGFLAILPSWLCWWPV